MAKNKETTYHEIKPDYTSEWKIAREMIIEESLAFCPALISQNYSPITAMFFQNFWNTGHDAISVVCNKACNNCTLANQEEVQVRMLPHS